MLANVVAAVLGMAFTIREVWWLYAGGILLYMCVIPIAEAAEQTILQRVVPYRTQGRVFGFAQSVEAAASVVSAFLIGPIAQFWLIPYMACDAGKERFGWLLGAALCLAADGIRDPAMFTPKDRDLLALALATGVAVEPDVPRRRCTLRRVRTEPAGVSTHE